MSSGRTIVRAESRPEAFRTDTFDDDAEYWQKNVKLYYTLKNEITGATFPAVELTSENWANLGLDTYPKFTADASGFTVKDLPTEIELVDTNNLDNVIETYTVSWSMEPPDEVEHYAFRDIKASDIGVGNTYPSLERGEEGWYYMLEDTFTFTLEVRQGDETIEQSAVRELLNQFQFNWSYGTDPDDHGTALLSDLLGSYAQLNVEYDEVTITGMWKYNVDGSPIKYTITEIVGEDETADYQIQAGELSGLLEEGDWYQIQYDNSNVSGDGQDTEALHDGGTLFLVRQGNTEYKATKIWLDSYGDGENSGRPDATYTLYRYIEGNDPSTAAQLTEYEVIAVQEEKAARAAMAKKPPQAAYPSGV